MKKCGLLNGVVRFSFRTVLRTREVSVSILLNPSNATFNLQSVKQDSEGRFLIAKSTIHDKSFFIVNIYAPTDYRDQDNFIRLLGELLMSNTNTSNVIIAGDWNTTLNPIDKPWKDTNYRTSLVSLVDELNLIDIYRQIHPIAKSFTYESKPGFEFKIED